jgi:hypothetical protein
MVKMILRVYADQEWSELPGLGLAAAEIYKASIKEDEPLTPVYRDILKNFGVDFTIEILSDLALVYPTTVQELDNLKAIFNAKMQNMRKDIDTIRTDIRIIAEFEKNTQVIKAIDKIKALLTPAESGIVRFYIRKMGSIEEAVKYVKTVQRDEVKLGLAVMRMKPELRKVLLESHELIKKINASSHITNAAAASAAATKMTNAEMEALLEKIPGGKRTRKGRKNNRRNRTRKD